MELVQLLVVLGCLLVDVRSILLTDEWRDVEPTISLCHGLVLREGAVVDQLLLALVEQILGRCLLLVHIFGSRHVVQLFLDD